MFRNIFVMLCRQFGCMVSLRFTDQNLKIFAGTFDSTSYITSFCCDQFCQTSSEQIFQELIKYVEQGFYNYCPYYCPDCLCDLQPSSRTVLKRTPGRNIMLSSFHHTCPLNTCSQVTYLIRACLHGGGGPQVGEVTRLAVVEKWPALHANLLDVVAWSLGM